MVKSKSFLDPLLNLKPRTYFIIIVVLALFIIFRPDCMLLEGAKNQKKKGIRGRRRRGKNKNKNKNKNRNNRNGGDFSAWADVSQDVKDVLKTYYESSVIDILNIHGGLNEITEGGKYFHTLGVLKDMKDDSCSDPDIKYPCKFHLWNNDHFGTDFKDHDEYIGAIHNFQKSLESKAPDYVFWAQNIVNDKLDSLTTKDNNNIIEKAGSIWLQGAVFALVALTPFTGGGSDVVAGMLEGAAAADAAADVVVAVAVDEGAGTVAAATTDAIADGMGAVADAAEDADLIGDGVEGGEDVASAAEDGESDLVEDEGGENDDEDGDGEEDSSECKAAHELFVTSTIPMVTDLVGDGSVRNLRPSELNSIKGLQDTCRLACGITPPVPVLLDKRGSCGTKCCLGEGIKDEGATFSVPRWMMSEEGAGARYMSQLKSRGFW